MLFLLATSSIHAEARPLEMGRRSHSFTYVSPSLEQKRDTLIVLDAGHGGMDEGAKRSNIVEKSVCLKTALLAKKHLEKMGYRVLLTRSRDVSLPLHRRVALANKIKGSLFVSLHYNSAPSRDANGIEIYYCSTKDNKRTQASKKLANLVLHYMVDETQAHSRGIRDGNFFVIRETSMPAILVEGGFITNKSERQKLSDVTYIDKIAEGIALGIDKYLRS